MCCTLLDYVSAKAVIRRTNRFYGNVVAASSGLIFFVWSVGIDKLDPKNLGWLTFSDQRTHWLGWRFFASDSWHWPLGLNPRYGWEQTNSIVFTDSFPGLAMMFKVLDLGPFNSGQYFGVGLLLGSLALFIGGQRLFAYLGLGLGPAVIAGAILGTTPVFWWMQRWYPALSSGVPMLVWALYFYLNKAYALRAFALRWTILLWVAILTHAYLVISVSAFLVAAIVQRCFKNRGEIRKLVLILIIMGLTCGILMYVIGYFTIPSKWAQTGGYGWYSANLLSLIDQNDASRWIPDVPSTPNQYEPTALGTGTILLLLVLIVKRCIARKAFGLQSIIRNNLPLAAVLVVLMLIAVSNTVSIASWTVKFPLPHRLEHGLSIFRSSVRFLWPTLITLSVVIIVIAVRRLRFATAMLAVVLVIQVLDYGQEIDVVSEQPNESAITVQYDSSLWERVPTDYGIIAAHPADNMGTGWAECALAAAQTRRVGQCGLFSRIKDPSPITQQQTKAFLNGNLAPSTIYWVSNGWLNANREELLSVYGSEDNEVYAISDVSTAPSAIVLVFPGCHIHDDCSFLGFERQTFGRLLRTP